MGLTRKSLLQRAGAGLVGIAAASELSSGTAVAQGPCNAFGYNNCIRLHYDTICASGNTSTCRVGYGFPSNNDSYVTRYSPNSAYELTCHACCPTGPGTCTPTYFTARVAVQNGGSCGCTWVA